MTLDIEYVERSKTNASRFARLSASSEILQHYQQKLLGDDVAEKINAAFHLGCMGQDAESELDLLISLANDKNPTLCATVIAAIGRINSRPDESLSVLNRALFDGSLLVRQYAAAGIGLFSPEKLIENDSVPYLRKAMRSKDPCLQEFVSETLSRIKLQ